MNTTSLYRVQRPAGNGNFLFVNEFIYTGEPLNPWRCECCATKRQLGKATEVHPAPANACCRKCGMDISRR